MPARPEPSNLPEPSLDTADGDTARQEATAGPGEGLSDAQLDDVAGGQTSDEYDDGGYVDRDIFRERPGG